MARDELVDRLYAVPLEEFVAERTRLAKELRAGGDREAAAELAKLPKPSAAAWALNLVAREDPDAIEEWLEATADLREATTHAAEMGGEAVRSAMAAHRAASGRVMEAVGDRARPGGRPLSEAMLDRVRALLQAVALNPALFEPLRAGRITEEKVAGQELPEPEPPRKGRAKRGRAPAKPDPEAEARAKRRAELERRVAAAEEEVERLGQEAARCGAAAEAADERLEDARRALRRTESEASAAHDAVRDAEAAAADAERELDQLRGLLRDAK